MQFSTLSSISEIPADKWDSLAGNNPFTSHAFLKSLEECDVVCSDTGWQAKHLTIYDDDNLLAIAPLYEKYHSYGEFIFDWSWADAYRRYGHHYYPKLLNAIPYSPITSEKIFFANHSTETIAAVLEYIANLSNQYSSWHSLYITQAQATQLTQYGFLQRQTPHFKWFNKNYSDFEHFLSQLRSRKRKQILKERDKACSEGIKFSRLEGVQITPTALEKFYLFYQLTYLKRSGHTGYLSQEFFQRLMEVMPNNILLINAELDSKLIACAFFIKSNEALYGRYWGCEKEIDLLHFETCYYQGIEYAIDHQLSLFDPGTQGEHKISRGFEPTVVYSNHLITDENFHAAIANYVKEEQRNTMAYIDMARERLPFKRNI